MFVKKLVEIASRKGNVSIAGLKAEDVKPRLAFHYGVPPEASTLAYDSIQHILAVSTRYGVIKLFGRGNTQAVLQSEHAVPSKFLQFIKNKGILINVTIQNHIEVWDIDKKQLACEHIFGQEITSFTVVQESFFMYIGDSFGNVSVFHLDSTLHHLVQMQYRIPFSESHCKSIEAEKESAAVFISPQPLAESKRVLIIFKDGLITLWGIKESKVIFSTGGNMHHQSHHEVKIVTSASWACMTGSKVVVGYSTGDIFVWSVPAISDQNSSMPDGKKDPHAVQNVPLLKLNLSYKMDKIPIVSLRWSGGDGKTSRLYINGFSDLGASYSFQVIILNENSESRIIKLALSLPEPCLGMEHVSYLSEKGKYKMDILAILSKSGNFYVLDDSEIEQYLLHCQSKSSLALPNHLLVRLPYADPSITATKLYSGQSGALISVNEDPASLAKAIPHLFQFNIREKDANHSSTSSFSKFSKIRKLLITGHADGTLNLWETSCPLLQLVLSIKHQYDQNSSSSMAAVTALHFDIPSQILLSGYQSGMIRIIKFKKEKITSENVFSFLQAKPGDYTDEGIKMEGAITSINLNQERQHPAVGTEKGYVALIQLEGTSILYQKQISSQLYSGITSLQFEKYGQNGLEKDILLVGMEDSSVFAITEDSGQSLTGSSVHPKKPSRALLMHVLDSSPDGACISDSQDTNKGNSSKEALQKHSLLLICSEDAVHLYTLSHVFQGIKKVYNKKKLNDKCCYATILHGQSSNIALMLIYACGKIEIRSLPDLSLLNETSLRGLTFPISKPHLNACNTLYAASEGDLLLASGLFQPGIHKKFGCS